MRRYRMLLHTHVCFTTSKARRLQMHGLTCSASPHLMTGGGSPTPLVLDTASLPPNRQGFPGW